MTKGQCPTCKDIIESNQPHEFVRCKCGACFLDTGYGYFRAGGLIEIFEGENENE